MSTSEGVANPRKRVKKSNEEWLPSVDDSHDSLGADSENRDEREESTKNILLLLKNQIETITKCGADAFQRSDQAESALRQLNEMTKQRDAELERLRSTADKQEATLAVSISLSVWEIPKENPSIAFSEARVDFIHKQGSCGFFSPRFNRIESPR